MSLNRINILNKEEIIQFFSNLQDVGKVNRFPPNRILNMDKTSITMVGKKMSKNIWRKRNRENW